MISIIRDRISASAQPEVLLIYFSAVTLPLVDTAGSMDTLYTYTYKLSSGVKPHNFVLKKMNSDKPMCAIKSASYFPHLIFPDSSQSSATLLLETEEVRQGISQLNHKVKYNLLN